MRSRWMTPETKKRAHEKLATFVTKIGYPDKWKDYSALADQARRPGGQCPSRVGVGVAPAARAARQAGRSREWLLMPQEINAYYNPTSRNAAIFDTPAGVATAVKNYIITRAAALDPPVTLVADEIWVFGAPQ